ncbi:MAG TPA: hypothetical protein ENM98_00065 [Halothiobacillaceae bacterium]|nr:hypothetical protein [Halothiobacillaceae bacterium]
MRLVLVAHGAPRWGFGHLNRCRVLAETAQRRGWTTFLLLRGPAQAVSARLPKGIGYVEILDIDAPRKEEWRRLRSLLNRADRLIVDHPNLDADWANWLAAQGVPWLTFTHRSYWLGEPDWLVNIRPGLSPPSGCSRTRCLFGPAFAVLRTEFHQPCQQPYLPFSENPRLFVTFGGGDDFGASARLLPALLDQFSTLSIDVVTTAENTGLSLVQRLARDYPERLRLYVNPPQMQPLICQAGAALVAGGTTTFELAALGIPFLVVSLVENQREQAVAWAQLGMAFDLGWIDDPDVVERAADSISQLMASADESRRRHAIGPAEVDGLGADRIIQALESDPPRR